MANFLDDGGFDTGFSCPSVKVIDLGMRVTVSGGRIAIDHLIRSRHRKRWTLASIIHTTVYTRAVAWTRLLMARHEMPTTLNID